jgi:hypothetical protein
VDGDLPPGTGPVGDQRRRVAQAREGVETVAVFRHEECARAPRIAVATPHEHLCDRVAHAQPLAQTRNVRGVAIG